MIALATSSWRAHLSGYLTVIGAVAASTALISGLFTVIFSAGMQGDEAGALATGSADLTSLVARLAAGVGGFAAIFVIATTLGFVLEARTRELGLLRLIGATPRQVTRMVRVEMMIFSLVGALVGVCFALPVGGVLVRAFVEAGAADPSFRAQLNPLAILSSIGVALLVAACGAWGPSRSSGRTSPMAALEPSSARRGGMGWARWVTAAVCLSLGIVIGMLGEDVGAQIAGILFGSFFLVAGLTAITPVLLPVSLTGIGALVRSLSPGVGMLSQADARFDVRRTASLAAPLILVVGLYAGFATITTTLGSSEPAATEPAVVLRDSGLSRSELMAWCQTQAEIAACTPVSDTRVMATAQAGSASEPSPGHARIVDPSSFAALGPVVDGGALSDLAGDVVAAPSWQDLGTRMYLVGDDGERTALTIGVTIEETRVDGDQAHLYLTFDQADQRGLVDDVDLWAIPAEGISATELRDFVADSGPEGLVSTSEEAAQQRANDQATEQRMAVLSLVGAAQLLAFVSVVITVLAGTRDRARAVGLLHRIGATRKQIVGSSIAEIGLVVGVAAVVSLGVPLFIWWRMSGLDIGVPVRVPWGELAALLGIGAGLALIAAVAGTGWQLRRVTR